MVEYSQSSDNVLLRIIKKVKYLSEYKNLLKEKNSKRLSKLEDEVTHEMDRLLCTTHVMNIYEDPICVLQHLCGAFQLMSKAHLNHTANLPRCLLKFHKEVHALTFNSDGTRLYSHGGTQFQM
jgi:hypothetical protein